MRRLLRVAQLATEIPGLTENALRWHIFCAPTNGLDTLGAVKRIGRRVLIDAELFHQWIDAQQRRTAIAGKHLGPREVMT